MASPDAPVTVVYQPGKAPPAGLEKAFRLKGLTFNAGQPVTVDAERAALVIKSAPKGTIKVLDGEPVEAAPSLPTGARRAAEALRERAKLFPVDPAKALHGLPQLSEKAARALTGSSAIKAIRAGEVDDCLDLAGIFCYLGAMNAAAEECARRAATLRADAERR